MKYSAVSIAAVLLFAAGQISAQCNSGVDEICIVYDYPDTCCRNCERDLIGELDAHVVLLNPSAAGGVYGFEFTLCREGWAEFAAPPGCFIAGYTFPPGSGSAQNPPEFVTGLSAPLPWEPCIRLVTVHLLVFCSDCWCFGVRPVDNPSVPGQMVYADGGDLFNLIPMTPCTGLGWDSGAMACINCEWCPPGPPIAMEQTTWGRMKDLYR